MPSVPDERLSEGGWTLAAEESATRFSMPTMRVVGHTRVYEDAGLREAVGAICDLDRRWRFFFATHLQFDPPLAPGIGPAMVYGTVSSEAKREFGSDLEERGFRDVSRRRGERVRTETGDRATLTKYEANYPLDGIEEPSDTDSVSRLPVTGWLGVWIHNGSFRLAGGAYPDRSLAAFLGNADERLTVAPRVYRDELLDLIRGVA